MDKKRLEEALRAADAAGDTAAATQLAAALSGLPPPAGDRSDGTEWMAGYHPANDLNAGQAALIGAGRTVDKFTTGVSDLFASDDQQQATATQQAGNDRAYAALQQQHPVATTVGEVAGYAPSMFIPGGAGVQIAAGGLTGAAMYNDPTERLKQGAIDAVISAAPYGAGKLLKRTMASRASRLANRADDLGWQLTPAEQLQSPGLRGLEASMESFPPTAGPIRKLKAGRQEAMNRAALEAIGEKGNTFADDALLAARARVGDVFDNVITSKTFKPDDQFVDALAAIDNAARQGVMGGGDTSKIIDNILNQAGDSIPGTKLQSMRTSLQGAAQQAWRSDNVSREYAKALDDMVDSIDDLIERTLPADDLAKWGKARKEWTAIKQLEKAKAINEVGDVSGRKLANNLMARDTQGYLRNANKSDLYDAARLSKAYPPMPDSGTATRLSVPMMLATAATAPASLPLMAGSNLLARMYANPEASGRLLSTIGRGLTTSDPSVGAAPHLQVLMADAIRRQRQEEERKR